MISHETHVNNISHNIISFAFYAKQTQNNTNQNKIKTNQTRAEEYKVVSQNATWEPIRERMINNK